jgi:glycosyltransferase involved in cell wall biosynthesis
MSGEERPLASIIVPAYNAVEMLENAVVELLGQTLALKEIVIIDDGSTDGTGELAEHLAEMHPGVRAFRMPVNSGPAGARERGVRESWGRYLWFVDVDDARADNALEKLVAAAQATDADAVICSAEYLYGERRRAIRAPELDRPVSGRTAFRLLLNGSVTGHLWNKLFRRELVVGIEFTPARVHSDLAMVAQLLARAQRVASIPDTLYSYVLRPGSIIRSGSRRAESLERVEQAVASAGYRLDTRIPDSADFRYFQVRYILLSGIKDALTGPYQTKERKDLLARLRSRLRWKGIAAVALRLDWKRFALAVTAKTSIAVHRRVLQRTAERLTARTDLLQ